MSPWGWAGFGAGWLALAFLIGTRIGHFLRRVDETGRSSEETEP